MTSNVALDVFIGLIFVFLIYSLLASVIQESIASLLNLRAAVLVKAIRIMLNDRQPIELTSTSAIGKFFERLGNTFKMQLEHIACRLPDHTLAQAFYKHPSIKYLSPNSSRSKPSYIEPKNFSSTIIQMLRGRNFDGTMPSMLAIYNTLYPMITAVQQAADKTEIVVGKTNPVVAVIQPETLDKLRQLYIDSGKDINTFTILLENWYNEIMDRANGWYKRQVRRILFFIGLGIAISGNVDTIKIYHILSKDKGARDQLVQMAIESQQKYAPVVNRLRDSGTIAGTGDIPTGTTSDSLLTNTYNDVKNDIDQSNDVLAMGWHSSENYRRYDSLLTIKKSIENNKGSTDSASLRSKQTTGTTPQPAPLQEVNKQIAALAPLVYDKFDWSSSLLGWLLVAMAVTLGAPFWFDLLSKFINIRAAGKRPDTDEVKENPAIAEAVTFSAGTPTAVMQTGVLLTDGQPLIVTDEGDNSTIAQG